MDIKIPLLRPYINSDELDEVKKVLDSGWIAQGPKVKELESKIKKYLKVKYAISVTNCTAALHLSLLSINIKKGDEVLVSDFTFPATGHSVLYCGAKPVFVDVDLKTYNINPDLICDKITKKTKAIIPVHTFGQPAEMDKIIDIAKDYDLKIIEDAACALGAKYYNKFAGVFGDLGCFSFHARKGITTGEGGMVVTNNKHLAEKIRRLSVFGMEIAWKREYKGFYIPIFNELGYNYKMSDITAAIGVAQIPKLDRIIKKKQELAKYWDYKLQDIESINSPYVNKNVKHVFQSYVAIVDESINRNKLIVTMRNNGIQTQIGTYASHIQPIYESDLSCPKSLDLFNRTIALPLYYKLTKRNIDIAASCLKESLEKI